MVRVGDSSTRWSGGFSLDDAARLYRRTRTGTAARCPSCRRVMRSLVSQVPDAHVRILHCDRCRRSVVLEQGMQGGEGEQ
ncbi:MAG TPA: hypothetical protein VNL18_05975 [Gemmatimonadales bacterium]|nr:hypothetical protein [Gemmatimonadales bacterium]